MHASTLHSVLDYLRKLANPAQPRELSDTDLLDRFCLRREEAAFTLLVQRHGPMVLNVCRRILGNAHEAEDAFQATFLVLIRNSTAIRKQQSLAGWLHGVALRIACKARMQLAKSANGRRPPAGGADQPASAGRSPTIHDDPSEALAAGELRTALDEEIERLPAKYRTPLVLCYLAEKTHEQVAHELGWPKSSVTARLARARELLQQRLRQRGFTVPAGLLAVLLTEQTTSAALPSLLTLSTVRLAVQALRGEALAATSATVLAGSFLKGTTALKLTVSLALMAVLGLATIGYHLAILDSSSSPEQAPPKSQAHGQPPAAKFQPRQPRLDLFGDPLPDEAVARMGSGRLRHYGIGGFSLFFSPDGKQLLSSSYESLRIWDTATGKLVRRFDFDKGNNQTSCRYVGDSIICVDVGANWIVTVQVLDAATGRVRRRLRIKEPANSFNLQLSPDGKRLAVAHKNEIGLYDTTTGEMVQRIKGFAWNIAFSAHGKKIAVNDFTDTIYLYNTETGDLIRELKRPGDMTLCPVFSPDGRHLATLPQGRTAEKGEVSIWNYQDGKELHRWTHPFPKAMSAAFSPDGKLIAIGGARGGMVLRDVETGKEVRRLSPHGGVYQIAFSPDGKTMATASPHGAIRLWDTETGKLLPASADPDVQFVSHLRFSNDGKRLFSSAGAGLLWDPSTGRELRRFVDPKPLDFKHPNDMRFFALSPDESLLAIARPHENITIRDAVTGKEKQSLPCDDYPWNLRFTPDSRQLIATGPKNLVRIWDAASGRQLHQMPGRNPLAVSPDGRLLAATDARMMTVFVYDLATSREKKRFAFPQSEMRDGSAMVLDVAFAPDSRSLAAVGYLRIPKASQRGIIRLWDLTESGRGYSFDSQKKPISSVAFSPDGRSLATGGSWGELILWEVSSGRQRHAFRGHESDIRALAFSPDGRTLAATSADAPVYVWDVAGSLQSKPRPLSNDDLQRSWSTLAGEDAVAAFQAIQRLAAAPEQTLPFLGEHLKPMPIPDAKHIRQLVEMLDSDDFQTRQKAAEELEKQNDAVAGLLQQIVTKEKPSLEVRRRLQQIAENIENKPESLRAIRAVEVLEWIGTSDALRLLGELAGGAADARLTREAVAAKRRLQR